VAQHLFSAGELMAMPFITWFATTFTARRFHLTMLTASALIAAVLPLTVNLNPASHTAPRTRHHRRRAYPDPDDDGVQYVATTDPPPRACAIRYDRDLRAKCRHIDCGTLDRYRCRLALALLAATSSKGSASS
jgi:hypothetical protein